MEYLPLTLEGKIAIVTGASRGLGKCIATGLAHAGANVVLTSRTLKANEQVAEEIRSMGRRALPVKTDVTSMEDLKALRDRCLQEFGKIDILVNNAGISPIYKKAEKVLGDEWDAILQTNLKAVFFCSQVMGKVMQEQKSGKIINITSVGGMEGSPRLTAYGSAKAGVVNLTQTMALEWAQYNIQVNAVAPGTFEVGVAEPILGSERLKENWLSLIPMKRPGKREEISGAVVFLASEGANYITGHVLVVDGGWSAGHLSGM